MSSRASSKIASNMALVSRDNRQDLQEQKYTPKHLILEESVKNLITLVQNLERRCASLEAEREAQKVTIAQLGAFASSSNFTRQRGRDISGYGSSDWSDDEPDFVAKQDVAALETRLKQRLDAAEEILVILRKGLDFEKAERKTARDHTDEKIRELKEEVAVLRMELREERTGGKLETSLNTPKETAPTPASADELGELKTKASSMAEEIQSLKQVMDLRIKQHTMIDDCATKEALYEFYQHLDREINSWGAGPPKGPFQGDFNELWHLRDRVITRLVMFDKYAEALKEAKNAHVDI